METAALTSVKLIVSNVDVGLVLSESHAEEIEHGQNNFVRREKSRKIAGPIDKFSST